MPSSPSLRECAPGRTSNARSRKWKSATTASPGKSSVRKSTSTACRTTPPPRNWRSASASSSCTPRRNCTSRATPKRPSGLLPESRTDDRFLSSVNPDALLLLQLQGLQVLPEGPTQVVAAQGEFHRRFQEAELVAGVVARALETIRVDRTAAQQVPQRVGELDFAAAARVDGL